MAGADPLLLLAVLAALMLLAGLGLARLSRRETRLAARLLAVQRSAGVDQVSTPRSLRRTLVGALAGLGGALTQGGLLSARTLADLEQTLIAAGFRGDRAMAVFVGAKVALFLGLPALAAGAVALLAVAQPAATLSVVGAAVLGLVAPDVIARQLRQRYLRELEQGLPTALDLMVICAEAGLALETTIERVATEMRPANPSLGAEFTLCASELRIQADRRAALLNMARRTGLESLRRLTMTLAQTIQFGTPLSQALRTLAAEMRQEQMVRFEARAARLPVLLTLPMILFILPTLFLVVAGPAMIQAMRLW